jgi:1-deoxy-D-xylulose 5-phosphate reductoisomerase
VLRCLEGALDPDLRDAAALRALLGDHPRSIRDSAANHRNRSAAARLSEPSVRCAIAYAAAFAHREPSVAFRIRHE